MNENLKGKTINSFFWSFGDLLISQGISLIIQIVLARLLSIEAFGIIGIVIVFVTISLTIIDSGFTSALIRDINTTQDDYSTVFYFNLFVSVMIYWILFFSAPFVSNFYDEPSLVPVIRILSLVLIISSVGIVQRVMLIKTLNFKKQTIVNVTSTIISGLLATYFAVIGLGIWSLVLYTLIKQGLQSLLYLAVNRWLPSLRFSTKSLKRFYSFGWKMLVSSIIDSVYANIYSLIIGKIFSTVSLGYYTNANKIATVTTQSLNEAISKVSYPVLSKLQNEREQLINGSKKIIKSITFFNFPLMIGLIAIANPLLLLLLGEKWAQVIPYFQLLCLPGIIYPLQSINLNILLVIGRSDLLLKLTIIKKVMSAIIIVIFIIARLDIVTLLWLGVVDAFISYLINSYYSGVLLKYSTTNQIKDFFPTLLAATFMGIIVFGFGQIVNLGLAVNLLLQILTGFASYIILCMLFRIKELRDTYIIITNLLSKKNKN